MEGLGLGLGRGFTGLLGFRGVGFQGKAFVYPVVGIPRDPHSAEGMGFRVGGLGNCL